MGEGLDDACVGFSAGKCTRFADITGPVPKSPMKSGFCRPKPDKLSSLGSTWEAALSGSVSVSTD
jgi:hypothetical protein